MNFNEKSEEEFTKIKNSLIELINEIDNKNIGKNYYAKRNYFNRHPFLKVILQT